VKKVAFGLMLLFLLPVLVAGAATGEAARSSTVDSPAIDDIPGSYARLYVDAASRFSIPWQLLAAVGKVECDHGRGDCYRPNQAGAMGPMQFLAATWQRYENASGDPPYDIYDARDSIFAAAAKLAADGIARDPRRALYSYNPSHAYVDGVLSRALRYGWIGEDAGGLETAVLSHPKIELRPEARADVQTGVVDRRILGMLLVLATEHELGSVGPFVTGHSMYVAGSDRISNHAVGRAVDIGVVDGRPVGPSNLPAREAALMLLTLPDPLRADELGSPWDFDAGGAFTDASHLDHIHAAIEGGSE
jgi:hypothetical protein